MSDTVDAGTRWCHKPAEARQFGPIQGCAKLARDGPGARP